MDFRVLGPVEVRAADGPREVHGRKELAVLAYLLVHLGRTVSADELITAVWGEDAPPGAQKSLHVRLSHLRGDLGDGGALIQRDGGGYRLAADPSDLDANRFAQRVTAAGDLPPEEALAAYDRALAELRGRPYADVADLDFVHGEARRLDELRLRAIDGRLRALLALGRHDEALPELDRRVGEEPLHEGLATLHMLALYRAGRQVEALEAYRALARRLDELGLEPSEEARELERRILLQDPGLAGPAPGGTNLGVRLTSFVGRAEELAGLVAQLRAHRLVTVTGAGGVGKTSLAAEAGRALLDDFPDGVWAVELAPLVDGAEIPAAVAAAIGVAGSGLDPGAAGGALDVVRDHLRDRRALLVLDNCEHLAQAAGQVAERLLAGAPALRILATSRHRLGAAGEAIVELSPFPVPPPDASARGLERFDCVRLFLERAQAGRPGFALDERTSGPVASICARLDGLPLAIELAAARLRALRVDEIAARLDDRFAVLAGAQGGGGRTLAGVVEWSYNLLSGDEQALFRRVAVFRGAFTLAAAEEVAAGERLRREQVADLLAALVDRSMVRAEGGSFRVLHTLAAFGAEKLAQCDEREDVVARHAEVFARRARAAALRLWSDGIDGVLEGLWPAREDLVAAGGHASAATALALMDYHVGDTESARRRLGTALARRDAHPRDTLAALRIHAIQLLLEGRLEAGLEAAEAAQLLAPETGDEAEVDRTAGVVGLALVLARDHEGALAAFAGLEERCAERGEHWSRGYIAGWCGFIALQQGALADARERSRRALEAFERCGDLWGFLTASVNLGRACLALDANDEAAAVFGDALAAAEGRIGDRVLPLLHDLGLAEARRGRLGAAAEHWARCTEAADRDLGTTGGWVMLTAAGLRWYPLMGAGHLARLQGRPNEAARRYGEAWNVLEQLEAQARDPLGLPLASTITLLLQARLAEDEGRAADAAALARDAVRRALAAHDPRLVARALDGLAGALSLGEDPGEAAELLGLAEATRERAGGPLPAGDQADLERIVARLRERLGDELDAALARGRSRDAAAA